MWIKNSNNKPDAMLTGAFIGLFVVIFCLVVPMFNGFQIPYTNYILSLSPPDSSITIALLGATFTSYVIRRNKKDQIVSDEVKEGYNVSLPVE